MALEPIGDVVTVRVTRCCQCLGGHRTSGARSANQEQLTVLPGAKLGQRALDHVHEMRIQLAVRKILPLDLHQPFTGLRQVGDADERPLRRGSHIDEDGFIVCLQLGPGVVHRDVRDGVSSWPGHVLNSKG